MPAVQNAVSELGSELRLLVGETASTLGRLWMPLLGLMLLGWSANEGSILLAAEIVPLWPWGVVLVLAIGMVAQLATILALLRLVSGHLGVPGMLATTSMGPDAEDQRDTGLLQLLTTSLLPFLAIYAAFGFVRDYAARVTILSGYRRGSPELLGALNPLQSPTTMTWMLVILVIGYLFKKLIDPWVARSKHPLLLGLVQVVVEASLAFVVLLGGFRIYEAIDLWQSERAFWGWIDQAAQWLGTLLPFDLPAAIAMAWAVLVRQVGPFLFDGVGRPLLWLAMAGLVFGPRALSLAELWQLGEPTGEITTRRERVLAKLRQDTERARGVRLIALKTQRFFFGGVDATILGAWQSLRLVLRAGWPFLGAFVIAFTVVDFSAKQLDLWVTRLLGGQPIRFWIGVYPFLDLLHLVVMMGITWVLLAVAYARALSIFAASTADVEPVLVTRRPALTASLRAVGTKASTVAVITGLVLVAASAVPTKLGDEVKSAQVLTSVGINDQRVLIDKPRVAKSVQLFGKSLTTAGVFVVVPAVVHTPGPVGGLVQAQLISGQNTYLPVDSALAPTASPGFVVLAEIVFEVDPADVNADARVRFTPYGENAVLHGYQEVAELWLGLSPDRVDDALATTEIAASQRMAK
ncbi:hypothetical protein [Propionicimonas sp.]|uniref:hypothetical protein n=1 Tax=Propionicimonas sp. TaxID=1955623 RepID=UPI00183AEBC6|nr:hypothetical protein [Propionicimonas sp.]MBU3977371.1 hypothetical protein [Actinomycetota bacterium]MBA3021295.1 hypothetical protein [Propionicimonas sp.]MBU3985881.1 hypothetical protein [Actinomycetota bacterium]MBU4008666.1 hypothetical protein [Actinomycetota bacterium]MBU4066184.1 hypothetical protein [Actinomycetota bacterium]